MTIDADPVIPGDQAGTSNVPAGVASPGDSSPSTLQHYHGFDPNLASFEFVSGSRKKASIDLNGASLT